MAPDRHRSQPYRVSAQKGSTKLAWLSVLTAPTPAPPESCGRSSAAAGHPPSSRPLL